MAFDPDAFLAESTKPFNPDEFLSDGMAQAQPEPSFIDRAAGVAEAAGTMLSGIPAEAAAGLAGIGAAIMPGGETGAQAVERVRDRMTITPQADVLGGQQSIQNLEALGGAVAPLVEGFEAVEGGLGDRVLAATGSPELAAIAHTLPTAALEALGLGALKGATKVPGAVKAGTQVADRAVEALPQRQPFTAGGKAKQRIGELLEANTGDIETAKFSLTDKSTQKAGVFKKLGDKMRIGTPEITKDKFATESIKQGFDEGVIAAVKASSPEDRAKMLKMVNTSQRGKKNKRVAMTERPTDVVGDSLMKRVNAIQGANKSAGKELEVVANRLRGESVDSMPAIDEFVSDLDDMGVYLNDDLTPNFSGSDIEGATAAENVIRKVVKRMTNKRTPDAHDIHRMKKFIDEQVTFGKNAEGLSGKSERVLKNLRRNLDKVLDDNFPDYNRVNTQYAETIGALDALQDVAGKKMDLTGLNAEKATGTLMRRVMSNAQSRVTLVDALEQIEGVANKYGGRGGKTPDGVMLIEGQKRKPFTDDLLSQVLFADELDSVFKPVARGSFEGLINRSIERGARGAANPATGIVDLGVSAVVAGAKKARGINEDSAYKAIRELLKANN